MGVLSTLWHRVLSRFLLLAIVLAVGTGIACGEADPSFDDIPRGHADETPSVAPTEEIVDETPDATQTPTRTFGITATYARAAIPPEQLVELSHLIVKGRVVAILPARWTTPDGKPPDDLDTAMDRWDATIITPVVIELDETPIVSRVSSDLPIDLTSQRIVLAAFGGQVGSVRVETNVPEARFALGEHVLVMLRSYNAFGVKTLVPTDEGLAWYVWHKYVLTTDGMAQSYDGYVSESAAELTASIRDAAERLPELHPVTPIIPTELDTQSQ
jgi:hypothetical protein